MNINFAKQIVLVTGATRGIGQQIADDFEKLGAQLILTGTNKEQIDKLNQSTRETDKKEYYCVDFKDKKSTDLFLEEISKYDKIDVCVNNAGINKINYIDETLTEDLDNILSVNLRAPFLVTREVAKIMKKNQYGRIINISSIFGVVSKEKRSVYSMSKFGLRGLTVCASNELAQHNVLVNAVSPGFVLTDLTKRILDEETREKLAEKVPQKRFATPDEISRVVIFLASNYNTYLTGQNIIVDGGFVNV